MEVEAYYEEVGKQSFEGGWEETKEDAKLPTREEIFQSLEKLYGPSTSCALDENNQYFSMILEEESCVLSDEMLRTFLPSSSYQALAVMNQHPNVSLEEKERLVHVEELIRLAFQNGEDIPPECKSVLFDYQNPSNTSSSSKAKKRSRK